VSLKGGVWWLIGDAVWGEHCPEQSKPAVYGNVTYFMDWIYQQMRVKKQRKVALGKAVKQNQIVINAEYFRGGIICSI